MCVSEVDDVVVKFLFLPIAKGVCVELFLPSGWCNMYVVVEI